MELDKDIKLLCESLVQEHLDSIPYKIEYVEAPVRYLGKCVYKKDYFLLKFPILTFNKLKELGQEDEIKDTVLHEIAHAITTQKYGKKHGHDIYWQLTAKGIGCNGNRTADTDLTLYKYVYECPKCHKRVYKLRSYNHHVSCGKCSPHKYKRELELNLVETYKEVQFKFTLR